MRGLGIYVLLIALFAFPAAAQITTATIVGRSPTPVGRPFRTRVHRSNVDTALPERSRDGRRWRFPHRVPPVGNYAIEVTATSGFKKGFRDGIVLRVNDTSRMDFALEVGSVDVR